MANKFKVDKWYQFKDKRSQEDFIKDHTDNGIYARRLGMEPFRVVDVDHLNRPTKIVTSSGMLGHSTNGDILDENFIWLSSDEAGFFDEVENPFQASEEQELDETAEFPSMTITIGNNDQAWSLYQMLKAHFKE